MIIDHSNIPIDVMTIELGNAARNPDSQRFPWPGGAPMIGSTVYHGGQLWIVDHTTAMWSTLVGCGHDSELIVAPIELRPVVWNQAAEDRLDAWEMILRRVESDSLAMTGMVTGWCN